MPYMFISVSHLLIVPLCTDYIKIIKIKKIKYYYLGSL